MCNQLVPRSSFATHSLTQVSAIDVRDAAEHSGKATEIAKAANEEMARVAAHSIGTMAQLTNGASQVRRQLMDPGNPNALYDDAQNKLLQVTGQNLITMTNAAQKEILQYAAAMMR